MANEKISDLPVSSSLDGTEEVPVVQGGVTVKTTTQEIADLGGGGGGTTIAWAQWEASGPSFVGNGIITSIEQVVHISGTDLEVTFAPGYANSGWCAVVSVEQSGNNGIISVHPISATKIWLEFGQSEGHWQPDIMNIHAIPINAL